MLRDISASDIVWLLLTAGLFLYALAQLLTQRGRAWPFRLGFLLLTAGLLGDRLRALPALRDSAISHTLRSIQLPLAVLTLALILSAIIPGRRPTGRRDRSG